MQMLWRRRASNLPAIELYADVDTAHEALPLSTVSESTDSDHHAAGTNSGGMAAAAVATAAASPEPVRDGGAAAAPVTAPATTATTAADLRESLDMSFEPPAAALARRRDVLWHTVAHDSPDATTRPHPHLALPPRPPRVQPPTSGGA